ncbi:hypothetical protein GCM10022221_54770 [Actinocorallia aurea]
MYLTVDLSSVPPAVELHEPDDFAAFSVRIAQATHAFVTPDTLRALAGDLAASPEWNDGLAAMLAHASKNGWLDGSGAIRAHLA